MPADPGDPVWLTAAETADYLKVSTRHLQRLRVPGENGPPFHGAGRLLRYDRREVDGWLRGGGGATPPAAVLGLHGPLQGATWADFADYPEHAGGPLEPDYPDPHPYPSDDTLDHDPEQTGN